MIRRLSPSWPTCSRSTAWPGASRIPADRRVKNLVLTDDGEAMKERVEAEITAAMPWNKALSAEERTQLLALIRKMLAATSTEANADLDQPGPITSLLVSALQESVQQASTANPPAPTGEVNAS